MKQNKYMLWLMLAALAVGALSQQFRSDGGRDGTPAATAVPAPVQPHAAAGASAASTPTAAPQAAPDRSDGSRAIAQAFAGQRGNLQVASAGTVQRTLPDDNRGSRHQRFILKLDNGHTVLVAHNIDLAPRIPNLRRGDTVAFYGEYEYTPEGGVIHWTHHDPAGRHPGGWLEHQGRRYE